jgi:uncharacterized membrane protein
VRYALTAAALIWIAALLAAPYALHSSSPMAAACAAGVYAASGLVCHQRPERSFSLFGSQLPVCARCTGLYVSAAVATPIALAAATALPAARARLVVIGAALPTIATWTIEHLGLTAFSNLTRLVAALPLGFVTAWLIVGLFPHGPRANHTDHDEQKAVGPSQRSL